MDHTLDVRLRVLGGHLLPHLGNDGELLNVLKTRVGRKQIQQKLYFSALKTKDQAKMAILTFDSLLY